MALNEDMELLRQVVLLDTLGEEKLRLIAFGAERRPFKPGEALFREGAAADDAYVVASGTVALSRKTRDGDRMVETATTGALLGELALFTPVKRAMTATATDAVEVLRISRPLFQRILEEYPDLAEVLRQRIAGNLQRISKDLGRIAHRFKD
ncbi:cyclic nucleotide-binding domain-containing protein [Pseudohoeflea coraliihabitans]|uniref:Cyclic nucleotide-binding domain-containing protein n=1 Tax=Pseudohoeflea coraliihabitans TaxID=2860393 RepID=A0ABS6WLG7_9HYPH|nr:cyclic nucleotide-binding domain-containing protein [Pseudohoeflea sp. DP4N28-3]MBW3096799.1 cyclic nucleotide-binding domain-containing protein [Pseudohoeflea sp. DP4N28-3]